MQTPGSSFPSPKISPPATAMILAAGRGERMRPLTDTCPKPMLQVQGKPLIQWHVEALSRQANQHLICNTAWLGGLIEHGLGDGSTFKTHIQYSREGDDFGHALETAGGIIRALPRLADTFWLVAGDVFAPQFEFAKAAYDAFAASKRQAHLWLVANPAHNPTGDFGLSKDGLALNGPKESNVTQWTYSTIGLYKQSFFAEALAGIPAGNPSGIRAALAPLLRAAMDKGCVSAQIYTGDWTDVGTPERLRELNL
ncbi:MAG: nucleotidyltransferase family protein [Cytophagales bacterium]|nr:nucleotidyltransferase family protein [Cytophagales bacterium]